MWGVLDTKLCGKICYGLASGQWFFPGTTVSSTNKPVPQYNWNIAESGIKHPNPWLHLYIEIIFSFLYYCELYPVYLRSTIKMTILCINILKFRFYAIRQTEWNFK